MSITSSIGIFSGIDSGSLINQLLQIEARPKVLAQQRIVALQSQRAALLDVNSSLLALKNAAGAFRTNKVFQSARATSSRPEVLTATAGTTALPGSYTLSVHRLVSTQQQISRGFANKDAGGVGIESLSVLVGGGRLDSETSLSQLNGGAGVERGRIRITDSTGASAVIDLTTAVTVNDVLDAINGAGAIDVVASVDGDRLRVADGAGGAGALVIENEFGFNTATSLGITGNNAGGVIVGQKINFVAGSTALSSLNDGRGVTVREGVVSDFRITARDGTTHSIRIGEIFDEGTLVSGAVNTLQGVIDRINEQTGGKVVASINGAGNGLTLTDTTGATDSDLIVQEALGDSRSTARELGILGSSNSDTLDGARLLAGINSTLSSGLNGGAGVGAGEFSVTRRDGTSFSVTIGADHSVADIINAINNAGGGTVVAALNRAGNGLRITDSTTGGDLIIADVSGEVAAKLNIATAGDADGVVDSGGLRAKFISGATLLSKLNGGTGVGTGTFRITDATGATASVSIGASIKTVDDLINFINSRPIDVRARINDAGDGILIESTSTEGALAIRVQDENGSVAKRLNIAGQAGGTDPETNVINGSFTRTVEFAQNDSLTTVMNKINAAGLGVTASIVNSGDAVNPFRLILTSKHSGSIGRAMIDTGEFDLGLTTMARGRDAVVFFGSSNPATALQLTSSTNTLDNVIAGVSIDLLGTSTTPVELVVSRDTGSIETAIQTFVESYNNVIDRVRRHDSYDQEANRRGALLGDTSMSLVLSELARVVQGRPEGVDGQYDRLFQVGVRIGTGGKLTFDRDRFRSAFEQDPEGVAALFSAFSQEPTGPQVLATDDQGNPTVTSPSSGTTYTALGVAEQIKLLMDSFTDSVSGTLTRRSKSIDDQISLQNSRIRNFDIQLNRKRQRFEAQFRAMEQAIASLSTQQAALSSLGNIFR